ncbi:uncharacterized protein ARMOST_12891 [Armillaria ostoyae]|uniref:Uncharacterized protein n=1 Tax=Armillaria ostoyae TaxID=47428 RepID=A0A284RL79_ARMOS|nr:uncharacterized protein ARMOST_12891 [Armillaria ostoyae]
MVVTRRTVFMRGYKDMESIPQFKEGFEEGARGGRRPFGVCNTPKFPRLIFAMNETISKAMPINYLSRTNSARCLYHIARLVVTAVATSTPILGGAAEILCGILQQISQTQQNTVVAKKIADRCVRIFTEIQEMLDASGVTSDSIISNLIKKYEMDLSEVKAFVATEVQKNVLRRFLFAKKSAEQLKDLQERVDETMKLFQTKTLILLGMAAEHGLSAKHVVSVVEEDNGITNLSALDYLNCSDIPLGSVDIENISIFMDDANKVVLSLNPYHGSSNSTLSDFPSSRTTFDTFNRLCLKASTILHLEIAAHTNAALNQTFNAANQLSYQDYLVRNEDMSKPPDTVVESSLGVGPKGDGLSYTPGDADSVNDAKVLQSRREIIWQPLDECTIV